jgi:hypothetical protein
VAEEDPQVDILIHRQPHRAMHREVVVDAVLLMHRVIVARQRHHVAKGLQREEELSPLSTEPGDSRACTGCQQFGLAGGELLRGVAYAEIGMRYTQRFPALAEIGRRCHGTVHYRLSPMVIE